MTATPDTKLLHIKMRGIHGCAKTEMLLAIARFVRQFGMVPALAGDGHNMVITSTKAQRLALHAFNHRDGGGRAHSRMARACPSRAVA